MAARHPSVRGAASARPEFVQAVGRAVQHYNAGRWRAAETEARLALGVAPADPSALNVDPECTPLNSSPAVTPYAVF